MKTPGDNRTIAHYRLLERIGEGGMGILFRAEDLRLDRIVALKLLPESLVSQPDAAERFLREARAAARINHPNVCTIFDIHDSDDDECFIAMEYVDGVTLRQYIETLAGGGSLMAVDEALRYATQIAQGLLAAHRSGIIHRDIKSDNIMLDTPSLFSAIAMKSIIPAQS